MSEGELTALVDFSSTLLQDTFGVSFDCWEHVEGWRPLTVDGAAPATGKLPDDFAALAAHVLQSEKPIIEERAGEDALLALPLGKVNGRPLLAVARVAVGEARLLKRAELACRHLQLWRELDLTARDLNICAAQIGDDFEELTFMRQLTEHLDFADMSRGAWQVAEIVLPFLAPLIQADALVLLPAVPDETRPETPSVGSPAVWVGTRRVGDDVCRRLIERFRDNAASRPLVVNHLSAGPDAVSLPGVEAVMVVPLVKGDVTLGWLAAINRTHRRIAKPDGARWIYSESEYGTVEASLLCSVASILATHARNVELFQQKEALLVGVVRAMVAAIDAKDAYTCGHSERVALVARSLGRKLGLDQNQCERLYLTGLVHDLGKIGIRDAVLRKPGRLTDEEFDEIKRHPDRGWAILQGLDELNYVYPGVLHHHESYDGTGYPDGLAADAIPLVARILAVADAYDAMVSDRPYRQGMAHEKVERILREGSGVQWDPGVVETFFSAMDEIKALWREYQPPVTLRRKAEREHSIQSVYPVPMATVGLPNPEG